MKTLFGVLAIIIGFVACRRLEQHQWQAAPDFAVCAWCVHAAGRPR